MESADRNFSSNYYLIMSPWKQTGVGVHPVVFSYSAEDINNQETDLSLIYNYSFSQQCCQKKTLTETLVKKISVYFRIYFVRMPTAGKILMDGFLVCSIVLSAVD